MVSLGGLITRTDYATTMLELIGGLDNNGSQNDWKCLAEAIQRFERAYLEAMRVRQLQLVAMPGDGGYIHIVGCIKDYS